jgi:sugar phosphate isomerase/epimerase
VCISAISTFTLELPADLDFWARHGIEYVGVSVAKLDRFGWERGVPLLEGAVRERGLRVGNVIGLGPFDLTHPERWPEQRDHLRRCLEVAAVLGAGCLILTTGPAQGLEWERAADALDAALSPLLPEAAAHDVAFAVEHTNSLRVDVGFVHTLRDAVDLARRLGTRVCMEINACWAERDLAATIRSAIDVIEIVQVSDYAVGTLSTPNRLVPGDGDIPIGAILGELLTAGYQGMFDLELIGPRIEEEGYDAAIPRAAATLSALLALLPEPA